MRRGNRKFQTPRHLKFRIHGFYCTPWRRPWSPAKATLHIRRTASLLICTPAIIFQMLSERFCFNLNYLHRDNREIRFDSISKYYTSILSSFSNSKKGLHLQTKLNGPVEFHLIDLQIDLLSTLSFQIFLQHLTSMYTCYYYSLLLCISIMPIQSDNAVFMDTRRQVPRKRTIIPRVNHRPCFYSREYSSSQPIKLSRTANL